MQAMNTFFRVPESAGPGAGDRFASEMSASVIVSGTATIRNSHNQGAAAEHRMRNLVFFCFGVEDQLSGGEHAAADDITHIRNESVCCVTAAAAVPVTQQRAGKKGGRGLKKGVWLG